MLQQMTWDGVEGFYHMQLFVFLVGDLGWGISSPKPFKGHLCFCL